MSCDIVGSPFSDPGLANPFDDTNAYEDKLDFGPLEQFNSSFGAIDQGCVDPQALSNAASPSANLDATLTPHCTPEMYPSTFNAAPASPYFQSVEQPFGNHVIPPHLQTQHLHRRSVSEPPDGALMQRHVQQQQGPVTFHRGGTILGSSRHEAPLIKRVKQTRLQPYQRSPRKQQTTQSRYQLRHNPTQPSHLPPTSIPHGLPVQNSPQPQHLHHLPFEHMPQQPQYVSSRVCTPAPEAIDPFLSASPAPAAAHMGNSGLSHGSGGAQTRVRNDMHVDKSLTIKMGIDELRALMTEVVQKAVEGLQTVSSVTNKDLVGGETAVKQPVGGIEVGTSDVEVMTVADDIIGNEGVTAVDSVLESNDAKVDMASERANEP